MTLKELEKMTIASLRSLAKAQSTKLRPTLKKKEIIDLLLSFLQKSEERKPRAASSKMPPRPPLQGEKKAGPELKGHAGEGETRDERVILNPLPALERGPESPYAEIPREYHENRIVL